MGEAGGGVGRGCSEMCSVQPPPPYRVEVTALLPHSLGLLLGVALKFPASSKHSLDIESDSY